MCIHNCLIIKSHFTRLSLCVNRSQLSHSVTFFCHIQRVITFKLTRILDKSIQIISSFRYLVFVTLFGLSVAVEVLRGGVASPMPNPPPFSSGPGTGNGGVWGREGGLLRYKQTFMLPNEYKAQLFTPANLVT